MTSESDPARPPTADVTVVMPSFNRSDTIARAIRSAQMQTLKPRQIVVADDASTDDTVAVAESLGATVLRSDVNQGSGPARNRAIEFAATEWVAFLDADDQWLPEHLETTLAYAEGRVMVCAPGRATSGAVVGNPYEQPLELDERLVLETSELILTSGCVARRSAVLAAGSFRPLRRAQDLDLWLRILRQGDAVATPKVTVVYHEHDAQASRDRDLTISCVTTIIDSCESRPWFRGRRDRQRALIRIHWDTARAAQFSRDWPTMVHELGWMAARPMAWPALGRLLRVRRVRRSRGREAPAP